MAATTRINCPKCGHEFNVEDVLAKQIEEKYRNEMNLRITKIQEDYATKELSLKQRENEIKQQQADIDLKVTEKLKMETDKAAKQLKTQFEQQYEQRLKTLSAETESALKEVSDLKNGKFPYPVTGRIQQNIFRFICLHNLSIVHNNHNFS
jgi:Ser-tRNA(Ala) deacylase AlaX